MDKAQRRVLLPTLVLLAAVFSLLSFPAFTAPRQLCNSGQQAWRGTMERGHARTALAAKGDADEDDDDDFVEVSGFSGFLIGIAMLPHVSYALYTCYNVLVKGEAFALGPYGLELLSCSVTVGLVMWSIGSFFLRGKGLPAGPLGLLGLSEGLAYLAALGLGISAVVVSVKSEGTQPAAVAGAPKVTAVSAPAAKAPAPAAKAPDAKPSSSSAPSMPSMPSISAPDFKMPDLKMPDIKVPEVKVPDLPLPELKKEEPKKAEEPKKEAKKEEQKKEEPKKEEPKKEAKKEEPKKPEPKKEEPKVEAPKPAPPAPKKEEAKPAAAVDYESLFD